MDRRISVSQEAVNEILKRSNILLEETSILLNGASKSVMNAEIQGWSDMNYIKFKDDFDNAERTIKDGLKQFEDILIPELKKILHSIEDFS
jgi:hypothetical protein